MNDVASVIMAVSVWAMIPPKRGLNLNPMPGDALREAYKAPTEQPLPADMAKMSRRIAAPLYLVKTKRG